MNFRILRDKVIECVGQSVHVRIPEERMQIPALWKAFNEVSTQIPQTTGYAFGISRFEPDGKLKYSAAAEITELPTSLSDMEILSLPIQDYAEFTMTGPAAEIPKFCDMLFRWLPNSGLVKGGSGHMVEVYPPGFNPQDKNSEIRILVPLARLS